MLKPIIKVLASAAASALTAFAATGSWEAAGVAALTYLLGAFQKRPQDA